jgi:hypothetical protein
MNDEDESTRESRNQNTDAAEREPARLASGSE